MKESMAYIFVKRGVRKKGNYLAWSNIYKMASLFHPFDWRQIFKPLYILRLQNEVRST